MIRRILLGAVAVLASSAVTVLAEPKDDIQAAVQKLADSPNYSWSSTTEGGFGGGQSDGKTEKDGYTTFSLPMRDSSLDVVIEGDKVAIKTDDGWKSAAEIIADADNGGGGGFDPQVFAARRAQNFKTPAVQLLDWAGKLQNIQKTDDGFSADFTDDAAKEMLTFGRRRPPAANADNNNNNGGDNAGPQVSDAKASMKFTIKDGTLAGTELHVTGTVSFNGNDRDVDRTTTTTFKDVGTTTITVPDEAKAKLNPTTNP